MDTVIAVVENVYELGREDYRYGVAKSDNQFETGTSDHLDWDTGWDDGEKDE